MGTQVRLVAIDPGEHAGIAAFNRGVLEWAYMEKSIDVLAQNRFHTDVLVIELPQVYRASRSHVDPNDLVTLAFTAGRMAQCVVAKSIVMVRPEEWKGTAPKGVIERRAREALSQEELGVVQLPRAASQQHNVWDAIGIGLTHLKRIGRYT